MANEYLVRTPTSTGNRRIFTWAGWVKRATPGTRNWIFNTRNQAGTGDFFAFDFLASGDNDVLRVNDSANTDDTNLKSAPSRRDPSSWMHLVLSIDTTKGVEPDRVNIYANGVQISNFTLGNYPTQNALMMVNSLNGMNIGTAIDGSGNSIYPFNGEMFDIFFIDGQALTPDVFGFYKEGKGYQSSGTTQATDFRPGQWVPKAPRTIKSEINRRGGFGVNGFYLPMNDSSNFGADFHCAPNSIIKLKGEDLPQPRNGAPTTSDAYVSQLRSDPYAANLVLAIPGISGGQGSGYGDYSADIKGSGSNKTVTAYGNAGIAVTASYYGSAMSFDGTGDYIQVGSAGESDFNFGSGDFTIETWINPRDFSGNPGFGIWDNSNSEANWLIYFNSVGRPRFFISTDGSASISIQYNENQALNEWMHLAMVRNGPNMVAYLNGVSVGITTTLGTSSLFTTTNDYLQLGRWGTSTTNDGDYLLQDLRIYKGVAKYKGGFDVPKPYTPVGIESWRQVPDTCNGNNFATMNPLASTATHTNGGLTVQPSNSVNYSASISNLMVNSGKWYCELRFDEESTGNIIPGISELENLGSRDIYGGATGTNYFGQSIETNDTAGVRLNVTANDGDIISMYMDLDSSPITCSFTVNGGSATTYNSNDLTYNYNNLIPGRTYGFVASDAQSAVTGIQFTFNFGQNPSFSGQTTAGTYTDGNGKGLFKYQPPAGYLALCEDNLPTPAIADPGEHFKCVLWTGDGNSGRSITGLGFKPDLVWIKERSSTSAHALFDSVRGAGFRLITSSTNAEQGGFESAYNPSFNNDGFTVGSDGAVNQSGQTYVAWCWRAGAGTTSTNTSGSIPSVVSVNQDAGFSIVSYTSNGTSGATVGHQLNKTPSFIIVKMRSSQAVGSADWAVYHKSLGATKNVWLNAANGANTSSAYWNNTEPTSSVFSLGNDLDTNHTNGYDYIAYCWAEIEGFSKFGSYTGTGIADGPFVYCGFKPAWIMVKRTDSTAAWGIYDSSRNSTNPWNKYLIANQDGAEGTATFGDFLGNGFKWRYTGAMNQSGATYIFMAFAESPFQTANAK